MSERKNQFMKLLDQTYTIIRGNTFWLTNETFFMYLFIYCYYSISLQIDHSRRIHDYDPFIRTFLTMLAEQGHLAPLAEQQNSLKRRLPQTKPHLKQLKRVYKRKKPR